MEAGESGGLRGTDGKLRGTSHAILSNQSRRGDRRSFRTWKPTAAATVMWEEERAGDQMEGSASKGQRITGQERFFFFPKIPQCVYKTSDAHIKGPATFPLPPGSSPRLPVPDGKEPLILNCFSPMLLFAPWYKSPCFFSCVFFSSTQLDIRRLTSLLPLNFYIWNNVDGPKE